MQTIPHLRPAIPTEMSVAAAIADRTPSESSSSFPWRRAGVALVATVALGACGGGKVYGPPNLASAPHDARAELPAGTMVVFEEFERAETCPKPKTIGAYAGSVAIAFATTPKPNQPKTGKPSGSPKPVPQCEGAEVQVEACQTGWKPDLDPATIAPNCVRIDFVPEQFKAATGLSEVYPNQEITTLVRVVGTVDRD